MDTAQISDTTEQTASGLKSALSSFSQEHFNTVPFEGSWTAGQVADHISKSCSGILKVIHGPTKPTDRQPDEKVAGIKKIFLDFSTKMKSPDFIIPGNPPHDIDALSRSLAQQLDAVSVAIGTLPLEETCVAMELPNMGPLTRLEWISFVNYHTQRHTHQLEKIADRLGPAGA